jgi:hypothetical protein
MTKYEKVNEVDENEEVELNIDKKNQLANTLQNVIQDRDWTGVVKTGESFVNEHLEKADIRKKEFRVHLKLLEYKYDNIVKGVLTRKPVYQDELLNGDQTQQKYFDINQNGLGENNLILASSVLGDLKNRRAEQIEHYYALLIEEPEAHLHPQKQNSFFNYLSSLKGLGVQIFISSHSPTITAKSDLDDLLVLQKQEDLVSAFALKNSELSQKNKSYLSKFLDVTKSQLFFSNDTIIVEGISEALLLPVFAEIMGDEFDLDKNGIELVNINGVAFEPFAKLYNSEDSDKSLSAFCSIITDNDKGLIAPKHFVNEEQNIEFLQLCRENDIEINKENVAVLYRGKSSSKYLGLNLDISSYENIPWIDKQYHVRNIILGKHLIDNQDFFKGYRLLEKGYFEALFRKTNPNFYCTDDFIKTQIERNGFMKHRDNVFNFINKLSETNGKTFNQWIDESNKKIKDIEIALNINSENGDVLIDDFYASNLNSDSMHPFYYGTVHSVKGKTFEAVLLLLGKRAIRNYVNIINAPELNDLLNIYRASNIKGNENYRSVPATKAYN